VDLKQAVAELDNLIYQTPGLVHDERMAWDTIREKVMEIFNINKTCFSCTSWMHCFRFSETNNLKCDKHK
jgi:hypothetical protein